MDSSAIEGSKSFFMFLDFVCNVSETVNLEVHRQGINNFFQDGRHRDKAGKI